MTPKLNDEAAKIVTGWKPGQKCTMPSFQCPESKWAPDASMIDHRHDIPAPDMTTPTHVVEMIEWLKSAVGQGRAWSQERATLAWDQCWMHDVWVMPTAEAIAFAVVASKE